MTLRSFVANYASQDGRRIEIRETIEDVVVAKAAMNRRTPSQMQELAELDHSSWTV